MSADAAIRAARRSDAAAIVELLGRLGYPETREAVSLRIERFSRSDTDRILVAAIGSHVAGVLAAQIVPESAAVGKRCRVTAVVVDERHRRKGIGRQLMESAEAFALSTGCVGVEIPGADRRTEAHAFYRRLGYQEARTGFLKLL
jgi:GNAT superfamily N-acetyltransferase